MSHGGLSWQYTHPFSPANIRFPGAVLVLKLGLVLATLFFTTNEVFLAVMSVVVGAGLVAASVQWAPYFRTRGPALPGKPPSQGRSPNPTLSVALDGGETSADDDPLTDSLHERAPQAATATSTAAAAILAASSAAVGLGAANFTRLALNIGVFWVYVALLPKTIACWLTSSGAAQVCLRYTVRDCWARQFRDQQAPCCLLGGRPCYHCFPQLGCVRVPQAVSSTEESTG